MVRIMFLFLAALWVRGTSLFAQHNWFSTDITVDLHQWAGNSGNLCLQLQSPKALPRFAFCGGIGLEKTHATHTDYASASISKSWHAEVRYFPFGQSFIRFGRKGLKNPYYKSESNTGCHHFGRKKVKKEPLIRKVFHGIFLAPGFSRVKTDLEFVALPNADAPISGFKFAVSDSGPTLSAGLQLRFYNLTVGAGYGFKASQPKWQGPLDIFRGTLNTHTFPTDFRLTHGPRLEVGINF